MNKIYSHLALRFFQFPLKKQLMLLSIMLLITLSTQAQVTITTQAASQTVECDGSGNTTELQNWLNTRGGAQAETSCVTEGITWSYSPDPAIPSGACGATGSVVVTFTATDACGIAVGTTATFIIEDTTPPSLTGTPYAGISGTNACIANAAEAVLPFSAENAIQGYSDNCGGTVTATLDNTAVNGTDCAWTVTYTFTVTDACGNALTGQTYANTGSDQTAPSLTGTPYAGTTGTNACMANAAAAVPPFSAENAIQGYTDNCGGSVTAVLTNTVVDGTDCNWTVTYTFNVTDACGNALTGQTYTNTGGDQTAPSLTGTPYAGTSGTNACMADAATAAPFSAADAIQGYTDNCGGTVTATLTSTEVTGTNCGWTVTYTFNVTDACGNALTGQTYTNTGSDQTAPSLTGTPYAGPTGTNACMANAAAAVPPFSAENAIQGYTDNCGGSVTAVLTNTVVTGTDCAWTVTYTFTVTDACGNTLTGQTYTNTGGDQTAPSLTGTPFPGTSGTNACMADAATAAPFSAADAIQGYTDNCGGTVTATLTSTEVTGTNCGWTVTYTFNVTDACGNALTGQTYANTGGIVEVSITGFADRIITVESGCMSQADIDVAFDEWLNTMTISGGCNPTATPSTTVAPANCGSVSVTWTATDGCSVATATSVFTVENLNPTPVFLNLPGDLEIISGSTQDQVDTQFNNWLALVDNGGGCNSVLTDNNPGAPSACGGSVEVTWTVTSDCEIPVIKTSTFSVDYSQMLYGDIISEDNPNAPLIDYYDGQNTAYITNGTNGSENDLVKWLDASWTRCLQDGVNIGHPNDDSHTPKPVANNKSGLYLQISAGDFITVDKISYKNNITIVVCGYLEIGEFIIEEGDGDDGAFLNNVNIVICPGGFLKATTLNLKNSVSIYNYGTLQVGSISAQESASSQCITGTGNFQDLDGNTIIERDPDDNWSVNDDFVNLVNPDTSRGWTFGDNCDSPVIITPLPIELLSFTSEVLTDHVLLHWVTAAEINNDYFNIERSIDLVDWNVIGHIAGSGNTNHILEYQFADMSPVNGLSYYRLKQTDFDGQFEYFDPIAVNFGYNVKELEFSLTKTNESWYVTLPGHEVYNVEIFDLTGRKIYSGRDVNHVIIPAQPQAVILRVYSASGSNLSRIIM